MENKRFDALMKSVQDPIKFEETLRLLSLDETVPSEAYLNLLTEATKDLSSLDDVSSFKTIINEYNQPCFVIRADQRIMAANAAAYATLGAFPGGTIDDVLLLPDGKEALAQQLLQATSTSDNDTSHRSFKVQFAKSERWYSLVMLPMKRDAAGGRYQLVFAIDHMGTSQFNQFLLQDYGMTASEQKVLELFVSGQTLEVIADHRNRSLATVRKQFYGIMNKFGVSSQVELLHKVYTLSNLFQDFEPTLKKNRNPFRLEATVLRPHGRSAEVTLAGDMNGKPVIIHSSLMLRCFPAAVEKKFKEAGILAITIAGPGYGKTSPAPEGQSLHDCAAADIAAVLDQLSLDQAVFFGTDCVLKGFLHIAEQIPERIKGIIVSGIVLPLSYHLSFAKDHNLYSMTQKLQNKSPILQHVVLQIGTRAFSLMGARGVLPLLYAKDQPQLEVYRQEDVLIQIEKAFESVFAQGVGSAMRDYEGCCTDWTDLVRDCKVPILLLESRTPVLHEAAVVRKFADDFRDKVQLIETDFMLSSIIYEMPETILDMIRSSFETPSDARTSC